MTSALAEQAADTPDWLAEAQHIAELYAPPETGRPSCLTDVYRVQKLLGKIAAGNFAEDACATSGIPKSTLHNWRKAAENGNIAAIAFVNALQKAEAFAKEDGIAVIRGAARCGPQYWSAEATFLERRFPDQFGRRQEADNGPKISIQIGANLSDVRVNVMTNYQTQSFSECQQTQALAATDLPLIEAKVAGESQENTANRKENP